MLISAKEWKTALTAVLNELNTSQYDKMLVLLQIPKQRKTAKFREEMPQKIIEHHGLEASIRKIKDAMDQIPRRDEAVQHLLLPFVKQLKDEQKTKGRKRKHGETGSQAADKKPQVGHQTSSQPFKAAFGGSVKPQKMTIDRPLESPAAAGTSKVQGAPVTRRIEIKSVKSFNKTNVCVVAEVKQEQTLFIKTPQLAQALGYKMEAGVEHRIFQALPITAEARIQSDKILVLKK
ncbi:uncharacterized protein LOC115792610 [Archocentrus centrarchus]|uniref:uncharacterized protein LOC115792610 n=1 Tax=Archocentrus centrarchus TaxID=63155 RepID=UPI0011E9F9B7|nr:uncharacterized protein LOC115792610 [Archocentrus centrarchus]XP_030603072.1 uncharacterized protein LOC115792610 [Archocentrus centrarchus]